MSLFDEAVKSDPGEDQVQPVAEPVTSSGEEKSVNPLIPDDSTDEEKIAAHTVGSEDEETPNAIGLEMASGAEYGPSDPAVNQFCEIVASIVARVSRGTESARKENTKE